MRNSTDTPSWLPIIACAFLSFVAGSILIQGFRSESPALQEDGLDVSIPSPELSPERVVTLQVEALRNAKLNPDQLVVCYSLASPTNREVTGPFQRFSEMVSQPPYSALIASEDWQLGAAEVVDRDASILVSTVSGTEGSAFRFYLRKQDHAPFKDCWMTEAVSSLQRTEPE